MAVYKFRISFEDYDDIHRDIEIKSNQTFADFHRAIHNSIGFDGNAASSFFMSNDYWHKGEEITLLESSKKSDKVALMETSVLKNFIIDPHQKIYYVFNLDKPWTFQIELMKITINEDAKVDYPVCVKSFGEAPKQFGNVPIITSSNEDLDFLNELEYGEDDDEATDEMGFDDAEESEDDEMKDEFNSDFEEEI